VFGGSPDAKASEFRVVRDTTGQVTLAVRAAQAQRVEVAGDFTHWEPLDLRRGADGWWSARVRAAPGAHQLSIRVDGARWTAPPGLPPVRDEFGATVGLLTVQ
jgi:1,4-alpha-glucan branching enzyme